MENNYGKSVDNPVLLTSIHLAISYLSNLVSADLGLHILTHRRGSVSTDKKPVDVYDLYISNGLRDTIYISIYSKKNKLVPPAGYLFDDNQIEVLDVPPKYIFNIDEKSNTTQTNAKDIPLLEKYLFYSKAVNLRYKKFPEDMIKNLYEEGAFFMLDDIEPILKLIKK